MNKALLSLISVFCLLVGAQAQTNFGILQQGDIGITLGAAHYFGDLNTNAAINRPKPAIGIFYRRQFNNYLAARVSGHFAQLGYSDIYSKNAFQQTRNLSFNTNIFEIALHGDFNFFKYVPDDPEFAFTPYATIGLGICGFDPYAYLNDQKTYLRPLGTEGQNIGYKGADGKTRKPYGNTTLVIPIGMGIKYSISKNFNLSFEITERLTNTDYLDDVSTTYVGAVNFTPNSDASLLQDRSAGQTFTEGLQRGWSKQKDQYIFAEIGLSFNISTYKCPAY